MQVELGDDEYLNIKSYKLCSEVWAILIAARWYGFILYFSCTESLKGWRKAKLQNKISLWSFSAPLKYDFNESFYFSNSERCVNSKMQSTPTSALLLPVMEEWNYLCI